MLRKTYVGNKISSRKLFDYHFCRFENFKYENVFNYHSCFHNSNTRAIRHFHLGNLLHYYIVFPLLLRLIHLPSIYLGHILNSVDHECKSYLHIEIRCYCCIKIKNTFSIDWYLSNFILYYVLFISIHKF